MVDELTERKFIFVKNIFFISQVQMKNHLLDTSRFQVGFEKLIPVREYCKFERGIGQCIAIIIIEFLTSHL
jgi:hypothetical protein